MRSTFNEKSIGYVPTMGNLHVGHLSLVEKSIKYNDITIISIFVNPIQFLPGEDFEKYPRTLEKDVQLIKEQFEGESIIIFAPKFDDLFPKNFNSKIIVNGKLKNILCDKDRPGHFDGVTTVVYLLFKLIKPNSTYFGQKDYQQFLIIEKMTRDLSLNISVHCCPTIREEDGLAMSSRNQYLLPTDREEALQLFKILKDLKEILLKDGIKKALDKKADILKEQTNFSYLEICNSTTLEQVISSTKSIIIAGCLNLNNVRLIDNIIIDLNRS